MNADIGLDKVETLLAHLLCSDKRKPTFNDALLRTLSFEEMSPKRTYTAQISGDRIYTGDPKMLLHPMQELLGQECECALIAEDCIKWMGFRRLRKAPRGAWAPVLRPTWYEVHSLQILPDGSSRYEVDCLAISSKGVPLTVQHERCIIARPGDMTTQWSAVFTASLVEDATREGCLIATVQDQVALRFPVPIGEHRDLFALRDAPLTPSGRRKAILHWVSRHTRATPRLKNADVSAHWRGVRTLRIDGLCVTLEPNTP